MKVRTFLYRLFFTRDDDLDLLQIVLLSWIAFTAFLVWQVGSGAWRLPTAAFALVGSVFATLAIAGTPKWVAELLARSKTPGEVGAAIASAIDQYGPRTDAYDDLR